MYAQDFATNLKNADEIHQRRERRDTLGVTVRNTVQHTRPNDHRAADGHWLTTGYLYHLTHIIIVIHNVYTSATIFIILCSELKPHPLSQWLNMAHAALD